MTFNLNTSAYEVCGGWSLAQFQQEALYYMISAFNRDLPRALAVLPTGAGKTVIGACLTSYVAALRCRTLILVPKVELISQWAKAIRRAHPTLRISIVASGVNDWTGDVVIASISMLRREVLERVDRRAFGLMLVDEAHHSSAGTWRRAIDYFQPKFCLGLSATPVRGDGVCVSEDFGHSIVYMITLRRLIQLGRLVDARGFRVRTDINLTQVPLTGDGDYSEEHLAKLVNIEDRNRAAVSAYKQFGRNFSSIAFAVDVAHAKAIAEAFDSYGVSARAGYGTMKQDEREAVITACRNGSLKVFSNVALVHEGFDAAIVKAVLLLRPYTERSARIMLPQSIGRALRPCPGYKHAVIIELVDRDERRKRGAEVNLFNAFDLEVGDTDGMEVDGRLISSVASKVEARKLRAIRDQIKRDIIIPSALPHLAPAQLHGTVETFDPIQVVEEVSGLRALLINGAYCISLESDKDGRPRVVLVRPTNGLYNATLVGSRVDHLAADTDPRKVLENVKLKLDMAGEPLVFANAESEWRQREMSEAQRTELARLTRLPVERVRADFTRGEASDRLTAIQAMEAARRAA